MQTYKEIIMKLFARAIASLFIDAMRFIYAISILGIIVALFVYHTAIMFCILGALFALGILLLRMAKLDAEDKAKLPKERMFKGDL
jgi:hypothetical protein